MTLSDVLSQLQTALASEGGKIITGYKVDNVRPADLPLVNIYCPRVIDNGLNEQFRWTAEVVITYIVAGKTRASAVVAVDSFIKNAVYNIDNLYLPCRIAQITMASEASSDNTLLQSGRIDIYVQLTSL